MKGSTNYPYPAAAYVLIYATNGNSLFITNLTYITNGSAQGSSFQKTTFQAVSNHAYFVEVGTTTNAANTFVLNWSLSAPIFPPPNDNFANASPLVVNNLWGTTNGDNTLASAESHEPSHAGYAPSHSVWYVWIAPQSGVVQFDTLGTSSLNDTVLAVYTGSSLASLSQVAANDDLYPYPQENYTAQNVYNIGVPRNIYNSYDTTNPQIAIGYYYGKYYQPYGGPSALRFNAVAGTTYYIAVDSKSSFHYTGSGFSSVATGPGPFTLNWAYLPSGVFRFATEKLIQTGIVDTDGNPLLLYQCSENETARDWFGTADINLLNTTIHTYYNFDAPGVLVTVTRVGGSSGRVSVDYTTVDGNPSLLVNGDNPAVSGRDYSGISGTLTFNDFEISKTLLIPITYDGGVSQPNRDFTLLLSNPAVGPQRMAGGGPAAAGGSNLQSGFGADSGYGH